MGIAMETMGDLGDAPRITQQLASNFSKFV
jgi:hypothetical protein